MENENPMQQMPEEEVQASEILQEPENEQKPAETVEEKPVPAKKNNVLIIAVAAVLGFVLLFGLGLAVIIGTDGFEDVKAQIFDLINDKDEEKTTEPETTAPEATEPEGTEPLNLKSYTVTEAEAAAAVNKTAASVGSQTLTNGALQVYYQSSIINFYSSYYYYLSYFGVDFSQPLDQQVLDPETNQTWQEYMLEMALLDWHLYTALAEKASADGFELDAEGQEYVAGLDKQIQEMADTSGYTSVDEFLKKEIGATATAEGMRQYMYTQYYYVRYYDYLKESLTPTLEQLEQYFTENEETLASSGVTKESGDVVDVRHVLITPATSGTDENGKAISTDADWEACRQKAQELWDQWKNGEATEDTFHTLAKENSADGNASSGGLYTGVTEGYMVETFNDWIFDESREYGNTDLVKTEFGYHIMFFVKREAAWMASSREGYLKDAINNAIAEAMEQYPIEVNYDNIALS